MLAAIYGVFGSILRRVSTADILASQILHVAKFCYFGVSSVFTIENIVTRRCCKLCYTTMMSTAVHRKVVNIHLKFRKITE